MLDIKETQNSVTFKVRLIPRSSRNAVLGEQEGALKIALSAPPVEGAANQALIKFLAEVLGVRKSAIKIMAGGKSKNKTIRIENLTKEAINNIFNL
jgi:hypothetical protein